jgi:AraC family transcriptional regulator, transcriptional activator of pobA
MNRISHDKAGNRTESLEGFYKRKPELIPVDGIQGDPLAGHFNVFSRDSCGITPYSRRDFYKVSLIIGTGTLHFADKWIEIDRPAMLISNPLVPYSWEPKSELQKGWFCIFSESFIGLDNKDFLHQAPIFNIGRTPIYFLDQSAQQTVSSLFQKMIDEIQSDYAFKYNVLRNYVQLVIHEAMRLQPADEDFRKHTNASARITELFFELLERQFPIDSPENTLKLRTAKDFACSLSIHVNHLNRSVKECTGKTTSSIIAARITSEARALLLHTDWDISEVAYALGFEYASYFTNFFRKQTGQAPGIVRLSARSARPLAV